MVVFSIAGIFPFFRSLSSMYFMKKYTDQVDIIQIFPVLLTNTKGFSEIINESLFLVFKFTDLDFFFRAIKKTRISKISKKLKEIENFNINFLEKNCLFVFKIQNKMADFRIDDTIFIKFIKTYYSLIRNQFGLKSNTISYVLWKDVLFVLFCCQQITKLLKILF